MKRKQNIIFIFIILFLNLAVNCKALNNHIFTDTYILYEKSKKELKYERFNNVISILEHIKKNNITHFNDDKIIIHLIYAYYKTNNFNMAKKNIKEFFNSYPKHPNIDYIAYIECLINIKLDKNIFLNILLNDYYKKDLYHSINTFFQLKKFIKKYPHSLYVPNAKKHLLCLKHHLSEYDLQILKFYFFRKEYIAVISRGQEMLQKYPETESARQALIYMEKSYYSLKFFDIAEKISKIIVLNKIQNK
ncbi:outer membrane protein assembly factor BamD [Buchnera aphidicola]|uniref:Part of large protein complex involved in outer membrane protein biogenesis n=1 Tax=Buchnera aphidicola str. Ua (Uroleucon ambrosiae) TaxID=1005057 RepID=G2LPQ1_BUCUM|nr:outer membrane protein assembly factor BamD [Buchnera aphidicola]AEO08188.1 part of large protein complex involved in outer membrane protein biogenesis [Buchnera aphidicola str. Ua (Uroleucon ambrosiae)]